MRTVSLTHARPDIEHKNYRLNLALIIAYEWLSSLKIFLLHQGRSYNNLWEVPLLR